MANPLLNDLVANLEMARDRFVHGLDKVPDDRLEWTPGGASRNALALAGREAGFVGSVAQALRARAMPARPRSPFTAAEAPRSLPGGRAMSSGGCARRRRSAAGRSCRRG